VHDFGRPKSPIAHLELRLTANCRQLLAWDFFLYARHTTRIRPDLVADVHPRARLINERLGLGLFESRRRRSVNRCSPESKTGKRLVCNTGILGL
jgi:hypothetical protein